MAAPCGTLQSALAVAADGSRIVAAGGTYPAQSVSRLAPSQNPIAVTVTPAPGQNPIFGDTTIQRPGISFTDLTFHGSLILRRGDNTIHNLHIVNGTLLVRDSNVTITDNLIEGGAAHDGINIAANPVLHNVLVQGNTVRDIGQGSGSQQHPDCIQIFDADSVTITQNNLYNCWNSGITFSPGAHLGISNILVQSNFIQGCIPTRQTCGNGGAAMDLRVHVTNVTIRNNTFGTGSVRLPYQPGVTAPNNIIGYLSVAKPCTTSATTSLIASYPTWACKNGAPGTTASTTSGNTIATPTFANATQGDLHLALSNTTPANQGTNTPNNTAGATANATSAGTSTNRSAASTATYDIDGQPLSPTTQGADQTIGNATSGRPITSPTGAGISGDSSGPSSGASAAPAGPPAKAPVSTGPSATPPATTDAPATAPATTGSSATAPATTTPADPTTSSASGAGRETSSTPDGHDGTSSDRPRIR